MTTPQGKQGDSGTTNQLKKPALPFGLNLKASWHDDTGEIIP